LVYVSAAKKKLRWKPMINIYKGLEKYIKIVDNEQGEKQMEVVNVGYILSKVQEDLAKNGIKISGDRLMEAILKFVAEKEDELIKAIKMEKSDEILKQWLETPVEVEATDSLKEHDLVI